MSRGYWMPPRSRRAVPEVGDIIGSRYRALRVLDITQNLDRSGTCYLVRRERGPKIQAENDLRVAGLLLVPNCPDGRRRPVTVMDSDYPLCQCHGWPWPCEEIEKMDEARLLLESIPHTDDEGDHK